MDVMELRRGLMVAITARIPVEYQEVAWIGSGGTQYIDTGLIPNQDTSIHIIGDFFTGSNQIFYYGSGVSYNNRAFESYAWAPGIQFNYGNGQDSKILPTISQQNKIFIDLCTNKNVLTVTFPDSSMYTLTRPYEAFEASYTMYLFALHRATILISNDYRICFAEIKQENTIIRNFVPCYRKSDNKPGMYDLVTRQFFTNAGTGEFTVGPDV